jgi:hypothetical protein
VRRARGSCVAVRALIAATAAEDAAVHTHTANPTSPMLLLRLPPTTHAHTHTHTPTHTLLVSAPAAEENGDDQRRRHHCDCLRHRLAGALRSLCFADALAAAQHGGPFRCHASATPVGTRALAPACVVAADLDTRPAATNLSTHAPGAATAPATATAVATRRCASGAQTARRPAPQTPRCRRTTRLCLRSWRS